MVDVAGGKGSLLKLPSDEELMTEVRGGDRDAFAQLVERHQEPVYRLALRLVGRPEEARDIAQEVFLTIFENPGAFKPAARFTTWLYRVTSNRSISHLRSRRIRAALTFSDYNPAEAISTDPEDQPDAAAVRSDETANLERELMRLPPRQRAALHLRYREGLSVAEVAQALGVSLKSAESLLFRGKMTLRARLAPPDLA